MRTVTLVAARSESGAMGLGGRLPWHLPLELKHFQEVTRGSTLVVGRRTWESLRGRELPGRTLVVVTSQELPPGVSTVRSLPEALAVASPQAPIVLAGGARIFQEGFQHATAALVSVVEGTFEGDVFFPQFPEDWELWATVQREGFRVEHYRREPRW